MDSPRVGPDAGRPEYAAGTADGRPMGWTYAAVLVVEVVVLVALWSFSWYFGP